MPASRGRSALGTPSHTLVFDFTSGEVRRTNDVATSSDVQPWPPLHPDHGNRDGFPHNALAHPLLVLCPPLGRWLHAHTEPLVPTWRTRWAITLDRVIPAASLGDWHRW